MMDKVLVAYATKHGATAEIAEKIGQVLRQAGLRTDVLPADGVSDLTPYKAVVLGSAFYLGRWRKVATYHRPHPAPRRRHLPWCAGHEKAEPGREMDNQERQKGRNQDNSIQKEMGGQK